MPELPEVETVRSGLNRLLIGKTVAGVWHDWPKGFPNATKQVDAHFINSNITSVERRAKVLFIHLSSDHSLMIHLKMTGQLVYRGEQNFGAGHPSDSLISRLPDKSTRVIVTFSDGSRLFFNDQRKFGWVRLMATSDLENVEFLKKLGPEPLDDKFSAKDLSLRLARRQNTSIKAALLDQSVISGVGNIYADEALWVAKIHPATLVRNLSLAKINKLYAGIRLVLRLGIEKGGSTDRNYVDAEGKKGSYLTFANVFRRDGQPCPRCGTKIIKIRVAGRGTHICPKEQRLIRK